MVSGRSTILVVGVLVGGSTVALPAGAAATGSTVAVSGPGVSVTFTGGGEANDLVVTDRFGPGDHDRVYVFDDVVAITPGERCARPDPADPTLVECAFSEQTTTETYLVVRLGGGDDEAFVDDLYGENSLFGGPGRDRLRGRDVDRMYGETGDDVLFSRSSGDGGPGNDTVSGEGGLRGGDGDDHLTGSGSGNEIWGGRGNDTILGQGGKDVVYGNSGRDVIRGGTGPDELYGGPDADVIYGNSGDDLLVGGPARDRLSGGPGDDRVRQ